MSPQEAKDYGLIDEVITHGGAAQLVAVRHDEAETGSS